MRTLELSVRFLGNFSVCCSGKMLKLTDNPAAKVPQLLALILYNAPGSVSKEEVRETLYSEGEADADNALKVLLFRLRKTMAAELDIPESETVLLKRGRYSLHPSITVSGDAEHLRCLAARARKAEGEKKTALLEVLCSVYGGELLPRLSGVLWVERERKELAEIYAGALRELADIRREQGNFTAAAEICRRALRFFPYEEEWMAGCIDAEIAQGEFRKARTDYETFVMTLHDELGVYPSELLLSTLRTLDPGDETNGEDSGAYYCNFPGFVDGWQILKRIVRRDHMTFSLVLFTVADSEGRPLENQEEIIPAMASLRMTLIRTLRRSDLLTRYSRNRMLVLLWNTSAENVEFAVKRVRERIEKEETDSRWRMTWELLKDADQILENRRKERLAAEPESL